MKVNRSVTLGRFVTMLPLTTTFILPACGAVAANLLTPVAILQGILVAVTLQVAR